MNQEWYANREFYKAAFSDSSQNAIREYVFTFFYNLGMNTMKKHFELDSLPLKMEYGVRSHSHAAVEITLEWLKGEVNYTPEEFAMLQHHYMPQALKDAYGIEGEY